MKYASTPLLACIIMLHNSRLDRNVSLTRALAVLVRVRREGILEPRDFEPFLVHWKRTIRYISAQMKKAPLTVKCSRMNQTTLRYLAETRLLRKVCASGRPKASGIKRFVKKTSGILERDCRAMLKNIIQPEAHHASVRKHKN